MALAAIAAGADGIMVDVHADPASARCDGPQALLPDEVIELGARLRELAAWTGRHVDPAIVAKEVETYMSAEAIKTIGVLGAGVMGGGIAQVCAAGGYDVVCYDIAPDALVAGREHATTGRYGLESGVERGKLTREEADAATARLTFTGDFDQAANTDLVVEAVPERLDLKIRVFRDLDQAAPAATILCSNSSGFPIQAIGGSDRPRRTRSSAGTGRRPRR